MVKLIRGEQTSEKGALRAGATAVIFAGNRGKVLMTRRADNGRWCLPGGGMDPGESAEETCVREVLEETGLEVRVTKLFSVSTEPYWLEVHTNGNLVQAVVFNFEATVTGGELRLSDETTEFGYFTSAEIDNMDVMEHHLQRVHDAMENRAAAIIR